MAEDELRNIAMALDIAGEDLSLAQTKNAIADKVHGMKDGFSRFFSMIEDPEQIKTRASIHKVIKAGILIFDDKNRLWQWKTPTGMEKVDGGKVSPNKTPIEALYDLHQGDQSFRDDMQAVLLTKNPKAGKVKEKVETE